jgi:hypothetical protein
MGDSIKKYKEMVEDGLIVDEIEKPSRASDEYKIWWEKNKDRILAQDQLNHEMEYKHALAKHIKNNKL